MILDIFLKQTFLPLIFLTVVFYSCDDNATNRGDSFYVTKDYKAAIVSYTEYIDSHPVVAETYYKRGRALEQTNQAEKALVDLKKASKLKPRELKYHRAVGMCHYKIKKYDNTIFNMNAIIKLKNNDFDAFLLKGRAQYHLGKFKEAKQNYDNALKYKKNYGEIYKHRGILYAQIKQYAKACRDFRKAKALNTSNIDKILKRHCK